MSRLKFNYHTKITFSDRIVSHSFLLRLIPFENEAQHLISNTIEVLPQVNTNKAIDAFGNQILTGYIDGFHKTFEFSSEGVIETYPYLLREELNPIYIFPSRWTKASERIREIDSELALPKEMSVHEKVAAISHQIFSILKYEGGITNIETSAEEALEIGKGVCQDFAHIMISLCRLNNIPARYVSGFIQGEGFSHAWVEYFADGEWHGYDPTHDVKIAGSYIKIAQGRDYGDCAIDKGVFRGIAQQTLDVSVKVEEE